MLTIMITFLITSAFWLFISKLALREQFAVIDQAIQLQEEQRDIINALDDRLAHCYKSKDFYDKAVAYRMEIDSYKDEHTPRRSRNFHVALNPKENQVFNPDLPFAVEEQLMAIKLGGCNTKEFRTYRYPLDEKSHQDMVTMGWTLEEVATPENVALHVYLYSRPKEKANV